MAQIREMTEQDMADLIRVFDAWNEILDMQQTLTGTDVVYDRDISTLGSLSYVMDVIERHVNGYDPDQDPEDAEWFSILNDMRLTPDERAEKLFGDQA